MVKRKNKQRTILGLTLKKVKKPKKLPKVKPLTKKQIVTKLKTRRQMIAERVLQSNAPPIAKERARRILEKWDLYWGGWLIMAVRRKVRRAVKRTVKRKVRRAVKRRGRR